MKQVLSLITFCGFVACGRLDNQYLPSNRAGFARGLTGQFPGISGQYQSSATVGQYQAPSAGQYSGAVGRYTAPAANQVPILRLDNNPNAGDGFYNYAYETADGTAAQEEGTLRGDAQQAQGSFTYTSPEGEHISVQYTADENGFQPQGSHLPTPPPIPEDILKSIELNQVEAARGGYQEGQYNEQPQQEYGAPVSQQQYRAPVASQYRASQPSLFRPSAPSQYRAPATQQQYRASGSFHRGQGGYRY